MKSLVKPQKLNPDISRRRTGFFWALAGTLVWSSTALFIGVLNRDFGMTPVEIAFWRTLLITLSLGIVASYRFKGQKFTIRAGELMILFLTGTVGIGFFTLLFNTSVSENGPAIATTLIYCAPVFVALGSFSLLGEKAGVWHVLAILINLTGCGLVAGITNPAQLVQNPLGALLGVGSGLAFASYVLLGKVVIKGGKRSGLVNLFYYFIFGTLVVTAVGWWQKGAGIFIPNLNGHGWLLLLVLSIISLCGYAFFNNSLKYLPATVSSLIQTLEPPLTALLSFMLLGKGLSGLEWLGTILIVSGVISLQLLEINWSSRDKLFNFDR